MEKKYDNRPLDAEQMKAARKVMEMSQKFADDMKQFMIHSHLWHKGFTLKFHVCPTMEIYTEDIQLYRTVHDGEGVYEEEIERVKGSVEEYENWETNPICTSREFIHLFDTVQDETGTEAGNECEETVQFIPSLVHPLGTAPVMDSGNEIDSGNGYAYN